MTLFSFFATCPKGLEAPLLEELTTHGLQNLVMGEAGVWFTGTFTEGMKANLYSRIASRILLLVVKGQYSHENDLYDSAYSFPWVNWFDVNLTFMVTTNAKHCPLKSLDFVTLRVKDAICDQFREELNQRPSIDTREPDVRVYVYLTEQDFYYYIDMSGEALFKRGARIESGETPLKKNLAAGLLALSNWRPGTPLVDMFCGSGTILSEAAEMTLQRAPGLHRHFGFEKLTPHQPQDWQTLLEQAHQAAQPQQPLPIWGYDLKGDAIQASWTNFKASDIEQCISLKQVNAIESTPPIETGVIVSNPPYGVRLSEQAILQEWYPQLGETLKKRYADWDSWFLTADLTFPKGLRLKPSRKIPLFNGALECRFFYIPLVSGSNRKKSHN
ncbi:ribosomal RNA large subunit methyltransferase L [Ferrovum sp. JA12]|uniref:THUMP domain-containing class I SAM-dependent RNA methyltransferase n=1 Tax=Ferrovum sp. JA12 TaxID=1356299 RepID=UPI0007029BD1|nr:THUMP domain-containing protein [Ferrovum sp. JA12]KRH79237.1 ribosomal RNA large subunit methyltransferase L [Ferrovum sp. JA12]